MKTLENPTTFFFKQAQQITGKPSQEINDFVSKLLNKDQCQLCKQNYDILIRIPRIMIHCGHTFCTPCLKQFYMNRRVRCPMCLKLVKQLDSLERLPINHTIFQHLVQKDKQICQKTKIKPIIQNASQFLFAQFQKAQKEAHMKQKTQKIDPQSGLPFCVFHPDRVEHFYCAVHSSAGCRVCSQIGHSKPECKVIDLYEIDDPKQLQQMIGKSRIENHAQSNRHHEGEDEESQQNQDRGIIIDEQTGTRYLKSRTGKLLPLADIQGDEEYFNENYLDGSGIQQLTGNYEDDDEDDEQ